VILCEETIAVSGGRERSLPKTVETTISNVNDIKPFFMVSSFPILVRIKTVHFPVSLNYIHLSRFPWFGITVLHPQNTLKPLAVNVTENIEVIDLSCGWLFSPRIITDLEISDLTPRLVKIGDEISFSNLLMVDIEQDLT
jgi:hypothetical protein